MLTGALSIFPSHLHKTKAPAKYTWNEGFVSPGTPQRSLYELPVRWNGNKQQKDGLTLQKQTCQPMIKDNWETHEKKKLEILQKVREILFFADQDLGISIY